MRKIFKIFLPFLILSGLYFAIRLQHLTSLPVFGDEAIYVRWSQIIHNEETLRFIPVTDGKQPLYMWATAAIIKFFADPLMASRLVSVFFGYLTMVLLYITAPVIYYYYRKIEDPVNFVFVSLSSNIFLASITAFIYLVLPFSFFFDRLATADTMLSFFGLAALLFSLLMAKYPRLDISMILGIILGLAWLTKSPAIYFIVLSAATFLFLNLNNFKKIYFPIISSFFAFVIYNLLRLGPQFHMIALRNQDYIWPLSEILKHPLDPLRPHINDILSIYTQYISIPLFVVSLLGLVLVFLVNKKYLFATFNKRYLIPFFWWFLPLLANAAIAKVFTARYILFTLPPLIILLGISLQLLTTKATEFFKYPAITSLLILLSLSLNIFWIYRFSLYPFKVSLPSTEAGYIAGWTSGWGIKDASDYLKIRSRSANVIVGTEGYFGTLPDGLQIYTDHQPHLTVFGVGLGFTKIPGKLIDAKNHGDEVYLLMNRSRLELLPDELNKVTIYKTYPKPFGDDLLLIKI